MSPREDFAPALFLGGFRSYLRFLGLRRLGSKPRVRSQLILSCGCSIIIITLVGFLILLSKAGFLLLTRYVPRVFHYVVAGLYGSSISVAFIRAGGFH